MKTVKEIVIEWLNERIALWEEYGGGLLVFPHDNLTVEGELQELLDLIKESHDEDSVATGDRAFIEHIQQHLEPGQEVICKICGKTAREICGYSGPAQ